MASEHVVMVTLLGGEQHFPLSFTICLLDGCLVVVSEVSLFLQYP